MKAFGLEGHGHGGASDPLFILAVIPPPFFAFSLQKPASEKESSGKS